MEMEMGMGDDNGDGDGYIDKSCKSGSLLPFGLQSIFEE